jgi:hypothetical protein
VRVFYSFIYLSGWIALAAGLQSWFWARYFDLDYPHEYGILIFCGTLSTHNFHRYLKHRTQLPSESRRQKWLREHRKIVAVVVLVVLLPIPFLLYRYPQSILLLLSMVASATLIYSGFRSGILAKPKQFHFIKSIIIATAWAFLCVFVPNRMSENPLDIIAALEVFLLVIALAIVFDLRDYHQDQELMPGLIQYTGKRFAVYLAFAIGILMCALAIVSGQIAFTTASFAVLAGGIILLLLRKKMEEEFFYSVGVDGLLVVHAIVLHASM